MTDGKEGAWRGCKAASNTYVCMWACLLLTVCVTHVCQHVHNVTSGHTGHRHMNCVCRKYSPVSQSCRWNDLEVSGSTLPSTFHSMPNVSLGYRAAQLNGSRVSLACYLKSLRSYSNTQLLWSKQRQLVTRYYRYSVYKNATLMQCMLCMMIKNSVWQPE